MSSVKTGDLLSFQDYSPEHNSDRSARIEVEAVHSNQYNTTPNYTSTTGYSNTSGFNSNPNYEYGSSPPADEPEAQPQSKKLQC